MENMDDEHMLPEWIKNELIIEVYPFLGLLNDVELHETSSFLLSRYKQMFPHKPFFFLLKLISKKKQKKKTPSLSC